MLSSEGNENGEKTTTGLISTKTTLHVQHTVFVHFITVVLHDHNVKLPETSQLHVLWRKCRTCCFSLFFTRSFSLWWTLGFLIFSPPLNLFFQQIAPYLPLQLSVALFLVELYWPVADFIFSVYSKFVDMTINLSLILQTTRIQKQFPLFVFVFIDSLVVSASQDADGYAISRQNNLVLHLGCHTCWLINFTLVCLWYGRTIGRAYGHMITKISRMGRLPNFLTHGAPLRARGAK